MDPNIRALEILKSSRQRTAYVADLIVNVTEEMEGGLEDWPANIQDGVYAALERLRTQSGHDHKVVFSYSHTDPDTGPFIRVIASAPEELS